jgi:hypothetical protein
VASGSNRCFHRQQSARYRAFAFLAPLAGNGRLLSLTDRLRTTLRGLADFCKTYEKQYGFAINALQAYNGAKNNPSQRYAKNVLVMRENFKQIALQHGACGRYRRCS